MQEAFSDFLAETAPTTRQLQPINIIVAQLTRGEPMDAGALYEAPYADLAPDPRTFSLGKVSTVSSQL